MNAARAETINTNQPDWIQVAQSLGAEFAQRAARHDRDGTFVADNYAQMREARLFSSMIPSELGGGGASHADVCAIVRTLGQHCSSTALSFAMHSHPVLANVFKHQRGDAQATAALQKIASNELVIAGTGANDWLASNGEAIEVEDGYVVNAHKRFVSGGPGADLFVTSAVHDGDDGPEVLHFAVPMNSNGIEIQSNWDTIGMRGTGSNDIIMQGVFIPEAAVVARRPVGVWHPMWDVIVPIALPVIVAAYVGIAEKAAELAVNASAGKPVVAPAIGNMLNELTTAQLAFEDMVRVTDNLAFTPDISVTDAMLTRKSIAARAAKATVEAAADISGGGAFFRDHPLERIVRDIRAIHFHPLPERIQQNFSGRLAIGLTAIEE